jgi:hypothetical protein
MKQIHYKIQNDGAVGFERENSTINLTVNQEGEEAISFRPKRIILHNCSIKSLDTISENYNDYFSVFDSTVGKSVIVDSVKYQSIKLIRVND